MEISGFHILQVESYRSHACGKQVMTTNDGIFNRNGPFIYANSFIVNFNNFFSENDIENIKHKL